MNLDVFKDHIHKDKFYFEYVKELHISILKHNRLLIPFMLLVFVYYLIGDFFIWKIYAFSFLRYPGIITCILLLIFTYSKLREKRYLVIVVNNIHCLSLLIMGFGLVLIGPQYNFKGIISCILLIVASHFFIRGYWSTLLLYVIGSVMGLFTIFYSYLYFTTYDHAEIVGLITVYVGIVILSFNNEKIRYNEFYLKRNLILEKDKTQSKNEMLHTVNKKLDVALKQLEEVDKSKNKFFSVIAHDLRSPFSSVVSLTEELNVNFKEYSLAEIESRVKIIEESTKSTLDFLNNLLYWASSQLNGIQINKGKYQLHDIVVNSISPYLNAAKLKNIEVNIAVDKDLYLYVDENTMSVVISNFFNNAIKYTPKEGRIEIFSKVNNSTVELSIKDNGIGMSNDMVDNLFKLDKTGSRNGTENEKGTGLGLVLSYEFIKYNNGEIKVESEVNKGSSFSIVIPALKNSQN